MSKDEALEIALVRCQVIAPLLALDGERGPLKMAIKQIAAKTHIHPRKGLIRYPSILYYVAAGSAPLSGIGQ
jgi:hypothetical protein